MWTERGTGAAAPKPVRPIPGWNRESASARNWCGVRLDGWVFPSHIRKRGNMRSGTATGIAMKSRSITRENHAPRRRPGRPERLGLYVPCHAVRDPGALSQLRWALSSAFSIDAGRHCSITINGHLRNPFRPWL